MACSADTEIDCRGFDLTFNRLLHGKWVVSDRIQIDVEVGLVEVKERPAR